MPTFKFIIRKNRTALGKDGKTLIFLRYVHRGSTAYFTTRKKVAVNDWDQALQRVKRSVTGHSVINMYLAKFRQEIEQYVNMALLKGIEPTTDYIKFQFHDKNSAGGKKRKELTRINFVKFTEQFIAESRLTKMPSTVKSYVDFLNILELYRRSRNIRVLDWQTFTMEWYYDFMEFYVNERGSSNNTFGKMIKSLKAILNAGHDQGHNGFTYFKDRRFRVLQEDVSNIYLNEQEIDLIRQLKGLNRKQREIRDLFVIACYTGLRYSDFRQITNQNISKNRLVIKTQKTGSRVVIPLHPVVKEIIAKNGGVMPVIPCNQIINHELKYIGRRAGLTSPVVRTRTHGIEIKEQVHPKWQLLSSHCARRSFATNLFKQGFPAISIMKITGHKSEKTFMKYIKVTGDETADMLENHWNTVLAS